MEEEYLVVMFLLLNLLRISRSPTNFLRANGEDTKLTNQDFIDSIGFVPGRPVTLSAYPLGNSIILKKISDQFNGSKKEFDLKAPDDVDFVPIGPVNLLVSLVVLSKRQIKTMMSKRQVVDRILPIQIKFNLQRPSSGLSCYIIALGGQGSYCKPRVE